MRLRGASLLKFFCRGFEHKEGNLQWSRQQERFHHWTSHPGPCSRDAMSAPLCRESYRVRLLLSMLSMCGESTQQKSHEAQRKSGVGKLHPAGKVSFGLSSPFAPEDSQTEQSRGQQRKRGGFGRRCWWRPESFRQRNQCRTGGNLRENPTKWQICSGEGIAQGIRDRAIVVGNKIRGIREHWPLPVIQYPIVKRVSQRGTRQIQGLFG